MKFTNAYQGVKKIFAAEILSLICSICATVTLALPVVGVIAAANNSQGGTVASLGGFAVLAIASMVLAIIAFIFKLIGVNKASKDEPSFKIALYLILAGIAVSVAGGIFNSNATASSIFSALGEVVNLGVTIFIIQGIKNLAAKLGDEKMVKKGRHDFQVHHRDLCSRHHCADRRHDPAEQRSLSRRARYHCDYRYPGDHSVHPLSHLPEQSKKDAGVSKTVY